MSFELQYNNETAIFEYLKTITIDGKNVYAIWACHYYSAVVLVWGVYFLFFSYRDLFSWEQSREKAVQKFSENQSKMMQVLVQNLKNDLHNTKIKV